MIELEQVPLASLDLLRQITDRHVIDQLLGEPMLTRAEIAARTGISKPTISESVRRLVESGLLAEAGQQQSGRRGRAGVFYALRDDLGVAVAVSASPDGLVAETLDVRGTVLRRVERSTPDPVTAAAAGSAAVRARRRRPRRSTGPGTRQLAQRRRTGGPGDRAARPSAQLSVPGRRARSAGRCSPNCSGRTW